MPRPFSSAYLHKAACDNRGRVPSPLISNSQSDPSDLTVKQKDKLLSEVRAAYDSVLAKIFLQKLNERQAISQIISESELADLVKKAMGASFRLNLSLPFTKAPDFYQTLFLSPMPQFRVREDDLTQPLSQEFDEQYIHAADTLRASHHWKLTRNHLLIRNETGSRVLIDEVVLAAIQLAQRRIAADTELDDYLADRHRGPGQPEWQARSMDGISARPDGAETKVKSWVVFQPEVDVPKQELVTGISSHGIIDYMFGVVSAEDVQHQLNVSKICLQWSGLPSPFSAEYMPSSSGCVCEAKYFTTFAQARAQALVQGAAMVVLRGRPVTNILTDGSKWEFYCCFKNQQYLADSGEFPFVAQVSRVFYVEQDLHIILRLVTLAILRDPENFLRLAQAGDESEFSVAQTPHQIFST
ncbi:hypothetical protein MVEN_02199100 [Mycena venus]|uniref:Uncharacterized protein n=1 Tax=Mycena venus TaxID=2733690 RepID=A0A8H7CHC0_9AGAR|nr:hypothetical protein MVEN_02199100 [Mycena venus]